MGAVVLACLCVWGVLSAVEEDDRLGPQQPVATATVLEVDLLGGRPNIEVQVQFRTAEGERVQTWLSQWSAPQVGDTLEVRYDPADPERYVRDARSGGSTVWVVVLSVAALAFTAVAVLVMMRVLKFPREV